MSQSKCKKRYNYLKIARVVLTLLLFDGFFKLTFDLMSDRMHGNARLGMCQFNMKQLGLALDQYAQDSDDYLPPMMSIRTHQTWRQVIYPYVKSVGVYQCPDDQYRSGPYSVSNLPLSYAANSTAWGKAIYSSHVITVVDVRGNDGPRWDISKPPLNGRELYVHKQNSFLLYNPPGTMNVLLADGHVKRLAPMATLTPINLWTRDNAPFTGPDLQNATTILTHAGNE